MRFGIGINDVTRELRLAVKVIEDGRIDSFVKERYASYESGIGEKISSRTATIEELEQYALEMGEVKTNISGKQEYLENIINRIIFA